MSSHPFLTAWSGSEPSLPHVPIRETQPGIPAREYGSGQQRRAWVPWGDIHSLWHRRVVSHAPKPTREQCTPSLGTISNFQKTFLVIALAAEGAAWIQEGEARDAAKHPNMTKGSSDSKYQVLSLRNCVKP